jgi:hypothetical protein
MGGGSRSRTRTCDKSVNSRLLYQLSYRGSAPLKDGGYTLGGGIDQARDRGRVIEQKKGPARGRAWEWVLVGRL